MQATEIKLDAEKYSIKFLNPVSGSGPAGSVKG